MVAAAIAADISVGCAAFAPPGPSEVERPPAAIPGPATFSPHPASDRQGLSPLALVETGTVPDEWSALMPDGADADAEDTWSPGAPVRPILAQEGEPTYDIPQSDDERVQMWLDYLTGRGRASFAKWLARSTRYVPIFQPILEQYALPQDLVFLSMIESGFSPRAYSWATAAGLWQFMPATGRRYGLKVGFWVDERRDFVKATHAAAQYLSALNERFGHWYLAFAAYNAGPGRVSRAIRRTGTDDFWRISRTRRLKRETKHYVPKLLAAAIIAKKPEAYGFESVEYLPPLRWDTLTVDLSTDLETLASACGLDGKETLELLNPELRCGVTPPGESYPLRVPLGTQAACEAGLASMSPTQRYTYRYHDVRANDDLVRLARLYSTTATAIASFSQLKKGHLEGFDEIVVPVKVADAANLPIKRPTTRRFRPAVYEPGGPRIIVHRVRRGDSLWRIAQRYRVSIRKLRRWNGLWRTNTLRIGQRIRIHGGRGRPPSRARRRVASRGTRHRVRAGESLWSIAVRHGTSVDRLCRLNGIDRNAKLPVGKVLKVR